ncbi:hypothetical protein RND81_14G192800 [Saponaria officinalis]|uniref:Uncharacterized protein n=2 Tax=Pentapetalae TaxID=1437201 RepID=A0AAW1GU41_SAPOF
MEISSLQMMKLGAFSAFPSSRMLELNSGVQRKGFLRFRSRYRVFGVSDGVRRKRVCCNLQDGDNFPKNNDGEPPESLFMKELKKRGISPASLLEEINNGIIEEDVVVEGGDRSFAKKNFTAIGFDESLTNQREQSMALNSEGLEGLIPRAKILLRVGGTFFLAFWPLILLTVATFAALYLYLGPSFVHDGSKIQITPPQYIDPYVLLQEDRITQ